MYLVAMDTNNLEAITKGLRDLIHAHGDLATFQGSDMGIPRSVEIPPKTLECSTRVDYTQNSMSKHPWDQTE
jgi:hypothetical protein